MCTRLMARLRVHTHDAEKILSRIRSGISNPRRVKSDHGIMDTDHARRSVGADPAVYAAKAVENHTAVDGWYDIRAVHQHNFLLTRYWAA